MGGVHCVVKRVSVTLSRLFVYFLVVVWKFSSSVPFSRRPDRSRQMMSVASAERLSTIFRGWTARLAFVRGIFSLVTSNNLHHDGSMMSPCDISSHLCKDTLTVLQDQQYQLQGIVDGFVQAHTKYVETQMKQFQQDVESLVARQAQVFSKMVQAAIH